MEGNQLGVDANEVIADLFTTMRVPLSGFRKMIMTVSGGGAGPWKPDRGRVMPIANEYRARNSKIPIRVLVFDVRMSHYGHIERPRQLAGGLVAALRWLVGP